MIEKKFYILLYYFYAKVIDVVDYREQHHRFCLENNLRGRVIISKEGLNGTVSGLKKDCESYIEYLRSDCRFANIEFKKSIYHEHAFNKLNVRLKKEIVYSGLHDIEPLSSNIGKYIEPEEFREVKDSKDTVILDVRSNYEHRQGAFKNSVTCDIDNFRDFSKKFNETNISKDKKVILCCTGGVKCEKASAYVKSLGYDNVYQLHGGIINYGAKTDGKDFEGECYVFDKRIYVSINRYNPIIRNKCYLCGTLSSRMVNCAEPSCNKHVAICEGCGNDYDGACSKKCMMSPGKRFYDGSGCYANKLNGYNPYKGLKRRESCIYTDYI